VPAPADRLWPGDGAEVIAVSIHPEAGQGAAFRAEWDRWDPGVPLDTLDSPPRSLVHLTVSYVRHAQQPSRQVAVLIPEGSHPDGVTGSCRTREACSWPPSCARAGQVGAGGVSVMGGGIAPCATWLAWPDRAYC
jgi:hypothetical protein